MKCDITERNILFIFKNIIIHRERMYNDNGRKDFCYFYPFEFYCLDRTPADFQKIGIK